MSLRQRSFDRAILLDFDGPVGDDVGDKHQRLREQAYEKPSRFRRSTSERGVYDVRCTNIEMLACWLATLDASNTIVLPGSQRCCMKGTEWQLRYDEMYSFFDELFGTDRRFLRQTDGDALAHAIDPMSLNASKNALMTAVTSLHGCAHLRAKDICLIDDHPELYEAPARAAGFHFITCARAAAPAQDSIFLFESLRWAFPGLSAETVGTRAALSGTRAAIGFAEMFCAYYKTRPLGALTRFRARSDRYLPCFRVRRPPPTDLNVKDDIVLL
jgi:hypothetical protein